MKEMKLSEALDEAAKAGWTQGKGAYISSDMHGWMCCAIGAAYCISHETTPASAFNPARRYGLDSREVLTWLVMTMGTDNDTMEQIIGWNDDGKSFAEIADMLRTKGL